MDPKTTITLLTGNEMPVMGLGTWQLTADTPGTIEAAIDAGYAMIDTSEDYGTQPGIGEGIKRSGISREHIYIVTKVEETGDAYESTKNNLSELQLDHADLVLIHRPPPAGPGEKLWEGLLRAREDGLTLDIGVSNYSARLIQSLVELTGEPPAVNQIEWSPFGYSDAMLRFANENGMVLQAYSPLTRGKRLSDTILRKIAGSYGKTPAQLLVRWNLQIGTVPIPKANKREHLWENIDVFDFEISEEDMMALNGLNEQYSSLGSLSYV